MSDSQALSASQSYLGFEEKILGILSGIRPVETRPLSVGLYGPFVSQEVGRGATHSAFPIQACLVCDFDKSISASCFISSYIFNILKMFDI